MRAKGEVHKGNPYLLSYSDLMAALLLVIILLLTGTLLRLQLELDQNKEKARRIIVIKYEIIEQLQAAFREHGVDLDVDASTGAIKLPSDVLFDVGSATLKPEGIGAIDRFFPIYLSVLLDPRFADDVTEIIVEGHTDPSPPRRNGSPLYSEAYTYNLGLSLERAQSVVRHILSADVLNSASASGLDNLQGSGPRLKGVLTANGLSFAHLLDTEGNQIEEVPYDLIEAGELPSINAIDFDRSRRVEFKFRLNDEKYLREIHDILTGQHPASGQ